MASVPPAALLFVAALIVRLALLLFGAWQDAHLQVKYTDIDYFVFTDAARFMAQGLSPYHRATYRYTPLLAFLLQVNVWHPVAGKLLFIAMDMAVGYCLYVILWSKLEEEGAQSHSAALRYTALFLFNPVVVNVSTRGNADCLVVFLVVGTLYCIARERLLAAAVMHGLAVHTKLYPVVFSLAFVLHIGAGKAAGRAAPCGFIGAARLALSPRSLLFGLVSAATFLAVTGACYHWYGWTFLYETYLYHFVRTDNRHNLSIYFYDIYLSLAAEATPSLMLKVMAFVPQLLLLLHTSLLTYIDLGLCTFLLTYIFVLFNKVCTVQYFVWYLALLPLVLPSCTISLPQALRIVLVWVAALLLWFWFAYRLEFLGENTFLSIWAAGLALFLANLWVLVELLQAYQRPVTKQL